MTTFDDIQFDTDYCQAANRFLLLHCSPSNQHGVSPVIVLPYGSLLTFISVWHDVAGCQNYIHNYKQKIITLFTSDRKIIEWNNRITDTDDNICNVYIFCNLFENFIEMKRWNGCYHNRIRDVYLFDDLEFNLLKLGVDHIRQVRLEFRDVPGLYRKFSNHARELLRALDNYFQDEIESLDDQESVENV